MRLGTTTLTSSRARKPAYDRSILSAGIVHLGIGAFHRAHQAVYIDDLLADEPDWAIIGASLRSASTADALKPQDGLYTVAVSGPDGTDYRTIASVVDILTAGENPEALLQKMADPAIRIVSLTVTEKGYCHDPATGELDGDHPDVRADLASPAHPRSAPGILVQALRRRRAADRGPFTVMSCDNLPENGATARRIVVALAGLQDTALADWIERHVAFPSTMVDRIVPATTDEDRTRIAAATGLDDAWPVMTEPFSQWVIEDNFCAGRPAFENAGAQMVANVHPFEQMKLRMLNASHSTLAYMGFPAGFKTVSSAIAEPQLARLVTDMMSEEIMPTLDMPAGTDLAAYRDALITRFTNPGLQHRTWQIAMDGSQKLPQRVLDTIRDRLSAEAPFKRLALCIAAWMRYVAGRDENSNTIDVRDPLADELTALAHRHDHDPSKQAHALASVSTVFGDLSSNKAFHQEVAQALDHLKRHGAIATAAYTNTCR